MVIDDTGSVEGIYTFIYCTKWRSGEVSPMPYGQTLKDRATQLLIKHKSGALVTQFVGNQNMQNSCSEGQFAKNDPLHHAVSFVVEHIIENRCKNTYAKVPRKCVFKNIRNVYYQWKNTLHIQLKPTDELTALHRYVCCSWIFAS